MRAVFLWIVLITLAAYIAQSIPDSHNVDSVVNKYEQSHISHTRRLLSNQEKAERKERKQLTRQRLKEKAQKKQEMKAETEKEAKEAKEAKKREESEKREREKRETENKVINNKNDINNEEKTVSDIGEGMQSQNRDNKDKISDVTPKNMETNTDNNGNVNSKNKRIFRYKFQKNDIDFSQFGPDTQTDNGNTDTITNKDPKPIESMPTPVIKTVKSHYESNQVWSKRTFYLLLTILILNVSALFYCICGRRIRAYLTIMNTQNNLVKPKKIIDSDSDSDITTDEQYID